MDSVKAPDNLRGDNVSVLPSKFQQLLQKRTEQVLAEKRIQEAKSADMTRVQLSYKPQPSQRFQQMLKDRIEKVLTERKAPSPSPTSTSIESDHRDNSEVTASSNPLSPDSATPEEKGSIINTLEEHSQISHKRVATSMPKSNLVVPEEHKEKQSNEQSPQNKLSTIILQQQTSKHQQARLPHIQPRLATDLEKLNHLPRSDQNTLPGTKRGMDSLTATTTFQVSSESSNATAIPFVTQGTQETQVAQAAQEALEPPTKRTKKSNPTRDNPVCTCSISTTCEVAAANGVKDCRAIPSRVIRKGFTKPKSM